MTTIFWKEIRKYIDIKQLAVLVRNKRLNRGLREVAKEIENVSPSAISQIENGKITNLEDFLSVCDWLEVAPVELIIFPESIECEKQRLRDSFLLNKSLESHVAKALASLVI